MSFTENIQNNHKDYILQKDYNEFDKRKKLETLT